MKRIFSLIALTAAMFAAIAADAAALSEAEADIVASRWARRSRLGVRLSPQRSGTRRYVTSRGDVFYGVRLGESGSVIVGDAGGRARVLAFSRQPLGVISTNSPLYALVSNDLALRAAAFAGAADGTVDDKDIDDLRVSPFIETKWSQGDAYTARDLATALHCYNSCTPDLELTFVLADDSEYLPQSTYRTPCGCVATAMAQTLRYWNHPSGHNGFDSVIRHPESPSTIVYIPKLNFYYTKGVEDPWNDGVLFISEEVSRPATTYNWADMVKCPLDCTKDDSGNLVWFGNPVTASQCEAIGELTYDCGVAVGLDYSFNVTGLAVTNMGNIAAALTNVFGCASAITRNSLTNYSLTQDSAERARAILANLDAKRPAILLVNGRSGGHAVVADGYGFVGSSASPYVHLNMGWSGQCDIWYNLPKINTSSNPESFSGFSIIAGAVYNITPDPAQVGEIVSGHVVGEDGAPVVGAQVRAYDAETGAEAGSATTTDEHGVYHFVLPARPAGYDIFAVKGDQVGDVFTGPVAESGDGGVGNSWGNDMTMGLPAVRVGETVFKEFRHAAEYAQRLGGPLVEVLRPCTLEGDIYFTANLTIAATNSSPHLSSIVCSDYTSPLYVSNGARLLLSNVVFSASSRSADIAVNVSTGSVLAVAGMAILGNVITADSTGFEVAGPLECGFSVSCLAAKGVGEKFGFASFADGAEYAAYVFNGYNPALAGAADGLDYKWATGVPVPPGAAYATFVSGSETNGYRTFDAMLAGSSDAGEIHLRRQCEFTTAATFSVDRLITSDFGDQLFVNGGRFTVNSGATLTLASVRLFGSAAAPLVTLGTASGSTGSLVLADGAVIDGFANTATGNTAPDGGAVYVKYGNAKLQPGSLIDGCSVTAAKRHGGGVFLYGYYASLELAGGMITNCVAGGTGGGVYANQRSTVRVTGAASVLGNIYRSVDADTTSDLFVYPSGNGKTVFSLDGDAAGGSIGVDVYGDSPALGDEFMAVSVDAETATNSASVFFSNDADLVGAVSDDATHLVWTAAPDKSQCAPERAVAFVVYAEGGETNYYSNLNTALASIRGDATVYVATNRVDGIVAGEDWWFVDDVEIVNDVTICTVDGAGTRATIYRDPLESLPPTPAHSLFVRSGGTLTLTNVLVDLSRPTYAEYGAIAVDGGTLVIDDGVEVFGSYISVFTASRASGAINVYNNGVLRMRGGTIRNNRNPHNNTVADYGVGAGVLVDNATAYFEGGSVVDCTATRYAGVYVGNGGKAYVSGAFTATGSTAGGVASNFAVQDSATLILTAPLTGSVGCTDGLEASTNIFGEVGCELTDEVVFSATNFHHDVTGALGAVATNAEGRAVLAWSSAFPAGEDTFEEDGVAYYRVVPPPPPPVYTIHYVGGAGSTGTMEDTVCKYGKVYNLRKCTLSKSGSHFVGWAWNDRLYDDGILIFNLSETDGDELDFVAVWVAD